MNKSKTLLLPIGTNDFCELRKNNYYYVDKTKHIEELVNDSGHVRLFTRPHRFGSTLNMSMLKSFLEIGTDPTLFDDLYISTNQEICEKHLGKHPVIFVSFKDVVGDTFEVAKKQLTQIIGKEVSRFSTLKNSAKLHDIDINIYQSLTKIKDGKYFMSDILLEYSLYHLSSLLHTHYGKRAVILIDDYNVPLTSAYKNSYCREMMMLIKQFLGVALKSNEHLDFAVLTGCQSVIMGDDITGLNNIMTLSITDYCYNEQFGFTEEDVKKILKDYHLENKYTEIKEWYGGYRFGNTDNLFCSQDVIQYVDLLLKNSNTKPQSFWYDACDNTIVKQLVGSKNLTLKSEAEDLVDGKSIYKTINEYLIYEEMDKDYNFDKKWSILFAYGYLTYRDIDPYGYYQLVIPNKEIKILFEKEMNEWFQNYVFSDIEKLQEFYHSLLEENTEQVEKYLDTTLYRSMCVFSHIESLLEKEKAYRDLLFDILKQNKEWDVTYTEEHENIIINPKNGHTSIVIATNYVKQYAEMDNACEKALNQVKEKRTNILIYGITFCKKRCKVIAEKI